MDRYSILYRLTDEYEEDINFFLAQQKGFLYFQSPSFFKVCLASKRVQPAYIIGRNSERIIGVLLYYTQVQTDIFPLRFFTSRNVIIAGPIAGENNKYIVEQLLNFYQEKANKGLYTQVRNLECTVAYKQQIEKHNLVYEDHLNILIDLSQTEEALWKGVHTKRRNEIRRAEKEGCTVEVQATGQALADCYAILEEVYQRAGLPLPHFDHFNALFEHSDATTGLRLFTAVWEGKIIGCMLCLAYGNTLYDYYAGAYSRYYDKHPNDLLPWAVFKWGRENGFTRFDFGGAGKPNIPYGVRDYKRKFGGDLVNYGRYEGTNYPVLYKMAVLAFELRQRALKR